jgi:E3 SUMO-protein ligase PIAS1
MHLLMFNLCWHLRSGYQIDSIEFYKLCISLSRGIDYALANVQSPSKVVEQLPMLLKKMHYKRKYDDELAAVMVLITSVKSACESGWFVNELESKELLTIASEIGKFYYTLGDLITNRPNSINSAILSTIVEKSYSNLKLGAIIVSIEAKPMELLLLTSLSQRTIMFN